ncbi:MAG: ATP synthase F1 subunit delta [Ferruginibacter sp.]|nr:ATP synthase F1 subunit delta [Bacteroidota bacterium]MBX2919043.1 ATP synthase F1 subunit delta [Ferruginibacter sp.]MCB0710235.1 ATP synthase F1 subunit delta [Chitinophagaceae bacterium]
MNNPRLASRYAKSLITLAAEQNQVDAVCADMKWINKICKSNPDFVNVLRSPVIKPSAKQNILQSITNNRVCALTGAFIKLLVIKARETNLPEIATTYIDQFNELRNIHKVKITTADPITPEMQNAIMANVKAAAAPGQTFEVETEVNNELIGGFLLETGGILVDASILRDLKDIQKQFMNNDYLHKIR